MANLTVGSVSLNGETLAFTAADGAGDTFVNGGTTYFHVKNGGASAVTVTVNSLQKCNQGFDHDAVVSVPASGEKLIGPFPTNRFNDSTGKASVSYSAVTSVTVAAIKL